MDLTRWAVGIVLGTAAASLAMRAGALDRPGAVAAAIVGALTFGGGGLRSAFLLLLFFVSSSALSRIGKGHKQALSAVFAKGGRRDAGQVVANGGIAALGAVLYGLTLQPMWLASLAGALAAVNADTWSTELGVLARRKPRLVTTGVSVEAGTSGAVTPEGLLAALGGAGLIGLASGSLFGDWTLAAAGWIGGALGALADSLLGATVQGIYWCPVCEKETERHPTHLCGATTLPRRGWRWLDNDLVNFAASVTGAVGATVIWIVCRP
ncbi:MAG TPA: DUF92 domain-containing protein [Anaerolineales bacterium]|nr:DUF92 domain-containing protein [Anaerolineales bacterium]